MRHIALVLLLVIGACSNNSANISLRSLERPARTAMVCFDQTTRQPIALTGCDTTSSDYNSNSALHAFVLLLGRGEVAAVRAGGPANGRGLIDTDIRVPGFTFYPVGDTPSDLVIPKIQPSFTYISHVGSHEIWSVPTTTILQTDPTQAPRVLTLDSAPTDIALSPDEQQLLVALPEQSSVAAIPISNGHFGTPKLMTLPTVAPAAADVANDPATYTRICPPTHVLASIPVAAARNAVSLGTAATPISITVEDGAEARVLIADQTQPIVHVLKLPNLDPLPPLVTGVPTRQVVITPRVPASFNATSDMQQFVYAIDATDGSVLVIDYATKKVLAVNATAHRPADRLPFTGIAQSLEIVSPGFDPKTSTCTPRTDGSKIGPENLHGTFVAVALADSTLRIVDIADCDAPSRGGEQCMSPADPQDQYVYIRRHRPRVGSFAQKTSSLLTSPGFVTRAAFVGIPSNGITSGPTPDLQTVGDTCPMGMHTIFPTDEGQPLLCYVSDPWVAASETWNAAFNSLIPGTTGKHGHISLSDRIVTGEVPFCKRGVLGAENIAAIAVDQPERVLPADQFVITSELPTGAPSSCTVFNRRDTAGNRLPVALAVMHAFNDRLVVGSQTLDADAISFETVAACFTDYFTYEVRTHNAYIVTGTRTGALSRIDSNAQGDCIVNTTMNPRMQTRAIPGLVFRNLHIAFKVANQTGTYEDAMLTFEIGNVPSQLGSNLAFNGRFTEVGVLPDSLVYSPTDKNLYIVDTAIKGLLQLALDPFNAGGSESFK